MKSKSLLLLCTVAVVGLLYAFVSPAGGEGFGIYVGDKLLVQKFNQEMKQVKNISITIADAGTVLKVKFYHCGMVGKDRSLSLKAVGSKLIKQWQFSNESGKNYSISIPVKELLELKKDAGNSDLYLYYYSKEANTGRLLAGITKN
ncbi:MAG: hypothetical protein EOP53_15285 [Sphingobacteriales bacterium]|nr:MAG: hypothetical protein EOP53_15285 [Sphingobacteriales bacterium]